MSYLNQIYIEIDFLRGTVLEIICTEMKLDVFQCKKKMLFINKFIQDFFQQQSHFVDIEFR